MSIDAATLRLRYPAFAGVDDAVIAYWLTEAARIVTSGWGDEQEPATLALAAHSMASTPGVLQDAIPAGVTSFRSGSFSATVSDAVASATGYAATSYGQEFAVYLRRQGVGPMLIGVAPCADGGEWW